jgi:hypothetical protein
VLNAEKKKKKKKKKKGTYATEDMPVAKSKSCKEHSKRMKDQ